MRFEPHPTHPLALTVALAVALQLPVTARGDRPLQVLLLTSARDTMWPLVRVYLTDLPILVGQAPLPPRAEDAPGAARRRVAAAPGRCLVVVWIEPHQDGPTLYLLEPRSDRVFFRRLVDVRLQTSTAVETIGVIVRTLVQSLLSPRPDTARLGLTPLIEKPAAAAPPARAAPHRRATRLALSAAYAGALWGPAVNSLASGGELSLTVWFRRGVMIQAGYRVLPPLRGEAAAATAQLQRHPIGVGLGWARAWRQWRFGGRLDLVLDYLTADAAGPELELTGERDLWSIALSPLAEVERRIWRRLFVFAAAGVEITLNPHRLVARTATQDVVPLLDPGRVQPRWLVGLRVMLLD